jgi:hypothetical protein
MVDWKRTSYLYRGRGLLEVVGPMGRGQQAVGGSDAGEIPKSLHTRFKTRLKFKIKNTDRSFKFWQ